MVKRLRTIFPPWVAGVHWGIALIRRMAYRDSEESGERNTHSQKHRKDERGTSKNTKKTKGTKITKKISVICSICVLPLCKLSVLSQTFCTAFIAVIELFVSLRQELMILTY